MSNDNSPFTVREVLAQNRTTIVELQEAHNDQLVVFETMFAKINELCKQSRRQDDLLAAQNEAIVELDARTAALYQGVLCLRKILKILVPDPDNPPTLRIVDDPPEDTAS